jgi:hypothetical protein
MKTLRKFSYWTSVREEGKKQTSKQLLLSYQGEKRQVREQRRSHLQLGNEESYKQDFTGVH